MELSLESSIVGLAIQWVGIGLVAILSFLLTRSIRRAFFDYWALSWGCLALSLSALLLAFWLPVPTYPFFALYFLGEYGFGLLFIVGCRNHASGRRWSAADAWMIVPACGIAALLPALSDNFNVALIPHALIMAGCWLGAFVALRPARREQSGLGVWVASVALVVLMLDFIQYFLVCLYAQVTGQPLPFPYVKYSSLYDLLMEILLGFGSVMIVMESVRHDLEKANAELREAGKRLKVLAERDPLTEALNRHAFYSLLQKARADEGSARGGSVAIVDIDDFKKINDTLGHAAGDIAIRAVARAIRSIIRPDDLLFRWGGDEFLVVLAGVEKAETRRRLERVNRLLARTPLASVSNPTFVTLSAGVAAFTEPGNLEAAIERADHDMYLRKQERKRSAPPPPFETVGVYPLPHWIQ